MGDVILVCQFRYNHLCYTPQQFDSVVQGVCKVGLTNLKKIHQYKYLFSNFLTILGIGTQIGIIILDSRPVLRVYLVLNKTTWEETKLVLYRTKTKGWFMVDQKYFVGNQKCF